MATCNGAQTLPLVLARYAQLTPPQQPWRLLVVENGSTDDTYAILASQLDKLPMTLLRCSQQGKNRALNMALDYLYAPGQGMLNEADLLVFTDDDALPALDWLCQWEQCARTRHDYAIFAGAIVPDWASPPPLWLLRTMPLGIMYGLTDSTRAAGPIHPGLAWGANMAIRTVLLGPDQRFDVTRGPCGAHYAMGSETELTRRLARLGHGVWFQPQAQVAHHIRPAQMTLGYLLEKARRAGRGQWLQDPPGLFPQCLHVPRWMVARYLRGCMAYLRALLRREQEQRLRCLWDLAYLRGYFAQAQLGRPPQRRVLITSYSGELGGMELRMAQEARWLQRDGYEVMLATPRFAGWDVWQQSLSQQQLPLAEFAAAPFLEVWAGRRWQYGRARLLHTARMRAFQAQLIHIAWCWTHYGGSATWLAYSAGIPAVISIHNAFQPTQLSAWHQRHLQAAFSNVRGIYAVSSSAMQAFLAIYRPVIAPTTHLAVIPNCVDVQRFRPDQTRRQATRRLWQLPPDALVIGSVGRLSVQKQPHKLLQVFCRLRSQFPALYLVLAGSGPLEHLLRQQVAHAGLTAAVIFTGFRPDVEQLLPALDLHLLLSRNEGFGIATIEAMACGVPVLATNVAGSRDILQGSRAGVLVAAEGIADCVLQAGQLLHDAAARNSMGQHGRREAVARFSEDVVRPQLQAFYHALA